jgi:hypothetical protein
VTPLCDIGCQVIKGINTKTKEIVNYRFCIVYQHKMTNNQRDKYQNEGEGFDLLGLCFFKG